ncbi:mhpA [Symbiodinium microadriaticum]|nr:mhpA [Symbiodinium microadriaticum]
MTSLNFDKNSDEVQGKADQSAIADLPPFTDVLIAGAGPVGMTLANLLARHGINVVVLDRELDILRHPRAIGTDNDGLRVLQAAGLARDAFDHIAMPRLEMHAPHLGKVMDAPLAGHIDGFPALAMFYQPDMEEALHAHASGQSRIQLYRGVEVETAEEEGEGVTVSVKDRNGATGKITCQYLAACDGANSRIRDLIGQAFTGRDYAEDWLIVDVIGRDVETKGPGIDHVMFYCNPHRPYPHLPAPGNRERWEFKLKKHEDREYFLRDDVIRDLIREWYPDGDAKVERKAIYRFQARAAKQFSKGRIFLVGDAAHVTPPFAGQGLVSGKRDAINLAWKLAWVVKGLASPKILESYDSERRPHVVATTNLARFIGSIVMPRNTLIEIVVHSLIKLSHITPIINKRMGGLEMKPKNRFKKGLFLKKRRTNKLLPGVQFPQFKLIHKDGRTSWSDDIAPGQLRLIGFGDDPADHLSAEARSALEAMGGVPVQICYGGQVYHRNDHDLCWEDETGNAISGVAPAGWCALVRPDQVVISDGPISDVNDLVLAAHDLLAKTFFEDFGLTTVEESADRLFMRGAAEAPYCLELRKGREAQLIGLGLEVRDEADLDALAALPGAEKGISDNPGGGARVLIHDPSGRLVEAVYGATPFPAQPLRDAITANLPGAVTRVNAGQRPPIEVPQVIKLGHVVLEASHYQAMSAWYTECFGLIPSDVEVLPDGSPAVAFFRFDCGDVPSDHHSIAMAQSFADKHAHSAFEVIDQDAVGIGQAMLRKRGYNHAWGMGRHILGSQIFDYWRDPFGEMFEHYCDGDVFTADVPTGIHDGVITLIDGDYPTTGDFIAASSDKVADLKNLTGETIAESDAVLLSPITRNGRFVCQGANYRQHMIESGVNPDEKNFNMIFTKATSCIAPADTDIIRPKEVNLLDYEVELGIILKREITERVEVTTANLGDYIAAITIVNDVSARDIQVPQMQFYKGKSYRTFGPCGPYLCLLEAEDVAQLDALDLSLTVNGEVRQKDNTANLVFKPAETLTELSGVQDFAVGDLIATGTPAGCALAAPSPGKQKLAGLLPEPKKWEIFLKMQAKRTQYLQPGDKIETRIASVDGKIDLGVQQNTIVGEAPVDDLPDGAFLVQNAILSMDPALVSRMRPESNYAESVNPGEVMHGYCVGQVIESRNPTVKVGEIRLGRFDWQTYSVQTDPEASRVLNLGIAEPEHYLSVVGITGATAYFTMQEICQPKPGEVMLVSAAASSVGQVAAQLGRAAGCRLVGIVSTDEKAKQIVADGFYDAAVSYRGKPVDALAADLAAACPEGVDIYFDNTSGDISEAVMDIYNDFARIAVIGRLGIAHITDTKKDVGRRDGNIMLAHRIRKEGFVLLDYQPRMMEAGLSLARMVRAGTLTAQIDMAEGIDNAVDAFFRMLDGKNQGKQLVKLSDLDTKADPAPRAIGRLLTHPAFPAKPIISAIRRRAA